MEREKQNLEFKIQFAKTNLLYLRGEPESEKRDNLIKFNKDAIAKAEKEIKNLIK